MAGFGPGGNHIALNGATAVEAVAAPGSGKQRQVLSVLVCNRDTVAHNYTGTKKKAATTNQQTTINVNPGETGQLISNCVILAATDESYVVSYETTKTTTESDMDPGYFEAP